MPDQRKVKKARSPERRRRKEIATESVDHPPNDRRDSGAAEAVVETWPDKSGDPNKVALDDFLDDVRRLARYAVETAQLPAAVNIEKLYQIRRHYDQNGELADNDFGELVKAYQTLERRLGPVNVDTLKATEDRIENGKRVLSEASKYVKRLWWRTYINIGVILTFHLIHHYATPDPPSDIAAWLEFLGLVAGYLIPFLYGALGADAYILRETTHKLHTRQFDPRRIPENRARLVLGTLSGGIIVFFVSSNLLPVADTVFDLGGAAAGFIAGYSTDFLFDTVERLIGAILPRVGATTQRQDRDRRDEDEVIRRYRRLMDETDDETARDIYKTVVEELEERARS